MKNISGKELSILGQKIPKNGDFDCPDGRREISILIENKLLKEIK